MRKISSDHSPAAWAIPNFRAVDITDIDFAQLAKLGIDRVAIDIDGTLLPAGTLNKASEEFIDHVAQARKRGYIKILAIATNRFPFLAKKAAESVKADVVVTGSLFRRKPSKRYYDGLLRSLGGKPRQSIMVGDRLLQDVFGGNRAGMYTLLVDDLGPEAWYDWIFARRWRQHKKLEKIEAELKRP